MQNVKCRSISMDFMHASAEASAKASEEALEEVLSVLWSSRNVRFTVFVNFLDLVDTASCAGI